MNYTNEFYNLFCNEKKLPINIPLQYGTNYLNIIRKLILSYESNVDKNFVFLDRNNNIIEKESENSFYLAEIINGKNIKIKINEEKYYFYLNKINIFDDELNSTETLSNIRQKYKIFISDDIKFIKTQKDKNNKKIEIKIDKNDENNKKIEDIVIKKNYKNNLVNIIYLESDNVLKNYNIYINEKNGIFYFLENSFLFDIRNFLEKKASKKNIHNLTFLNINKNYEIIDKNQEKNIKIKEITNEKKIIYLTNKLINNSNHILLNNKNNFLYFQYPQEIYEKKINSIEEKINNIIVFGQTGCGKTTLINRLTNFMNQIEFEDKIKYNLILESNSDIGSSKTKSINKYFIKRNFNKEDYNNIKSMLIIDTPGFGDNNDINIDFKISKMAKKIFKEINNISAIIFVINKNDFKNDSYQNYIFDSVFNLFGADIKNNIFFFITHCDNYLDKNEQIEIENNINFFLNKFLNISINDYNIQKNKIYYISNSDIKNNWNESEKKYLHFFNYLNNIEKVELKSTIENLEKREKLNKDSQNLASIIDECNKIKKNLNAIDNENKNVFKIKFNKILAINNRYKENNNNVHNKNNNDDDDILNLNSKMNDLIFSKKKKEMKNLCETLKSIEKLNENIQNETENLMRISFNKNLFYSNKDYITNEFIKREENKNKANINKKSIESCNNLIKVNDILKKIHDKKNIPEIKEAKEKKDFKIFKQLKLK